MYEDGNEGDRNVYLCQGRSQGVESEQKGSAEVGSQARRQGSISHLPQVGAITR